MSTVDNPQRSPSPPVSASVGTAISLSPPEPLTPGCVAGFEKKKGPVTHVGTGPVPPWRTALEESMKRALRDDDVWDPTTNMAEVSQEYLHEALGEVRANSQRDLTLWLADNTVEEHLQQAQGVRVTFKFRGRNASTRLAVPPWIQNLRKLVAASVSHG